jgi:2-iminobutanoate/2-iminopropanoate deaminase
LKVVVSTDAAPAAVGPYSQAIKANGFLFVSGQIPIDPQTGQIDAMDVVGQVKQVLANLDAILNAEGLTVADVVKTTIYLTSLDYFKQVNEVYATIFETNPPARSTVEVSALPKGAKVEIEAIAALK